jgi:hypothetical protein
VSDIYKRGVTMSSEYDDTTAVAHLPNLDIEIHHRRPWEGNEEILTITLRAAPSFESFFQFLEAANPAIAWMGAIETAWTPWLRLAKPAPVPRLQRDA